MSNSKDGSKTIFSLIFMAYAISYIARKGYSTCMSDICSELSLTKSFAGAVSTGYLACYGSGQLISGILADRFSPKKMIMTGLLGAGIANLFTGLSVSGPMLLIAWCLNGCFQSMLWASVVRSIAEWLPERKRSFAGTTISATLPIGTAFSYLISSICLKFFTWRTAFFVYSICVIFCAFIWHFGCRKKKDYISEMISINRHEQEDNAKNLEHSNLPSLFYCITACGLLLTIPSIFCNGILKDGITEWIPSYISEEYRASSSMAALFVTLLPVINLTGAYIASAINDKITHNEMKTSGILFMIASLGAVLLIISGKSLEKTSEPSLIKTLLCVFMFAIITSTMHGANNMFLTFMPLHFSKVGRTASVTGFLNASAYLAAALSGIISGNVLEKNGWNAMLLFWFFIALAGIPLCFLGGLLWKKGQKKIDN